MGSICFETTRQLESEESLGEKQVRHKSRAQIKYFERVDAGSPRGKTTAPYPQGFHQLIK